MLEWSPSDIYFVYIFKVIITKKSGCLLLGGSWENGILNSLKPLFFNLPLRIL